jgi:DNA-binding CsgD family transcriptional regulator
MTSAVSAHDLGYLGLPQIIGAIGCATFGKDLLDFLYQVCGAEHCAAMHISPRALSRNASANLSRNASASLSRIASASLDGTDDVQRQFSLYQDRCWLRDPMIDAVRRQLGTSSSSMVRASISELSKVEYFERVYARTKICDRFLLCGRSDDGIVGVSVLRSQKFGPFPADCLARVHDLASTLLAVIARHVALCRQKPDFSLALTSLGDIEACITGAPCPLPRREAEVCARILYDASARGIALELGIGEETVMTYRKRAYQRLGIETRRELLLWYLDLWSVSEVGRGRRQTQ